MFGSPWETFVGLLLLLFDAMDLFMHGDFLGEDDEESALCRGPEL